jgi:hypothetical protein
LAHEGSNAARHCHGEPSLAQFAVKPHGEGPGEVEIPALDVDDRPGFERGLDGATEQLAEP